MVKPLAWIGVLSSLVIAAALCVLASQGQRRPTLPELSRPYHAVALANGQVFFGRLDGLGGDYLVLRDAFYIQTRQNPGTQQAINVLVKRGGEAHGPDRMILNRQQVVMMEPVTDGSQIAKLIAEQNAVR
jgi:hypothetical protein